jgi:hypothetical protein
MFSYIQTGQRLIILSPSTDPVQNGGYIFARRGVYVLGYLYFILKQIRNLSSVYFQLHKSHPSIDVIAVSSVLEVRLLKGLY